LTRGHVLFVYDGRLGGGERSVVGSEDGSVGSVAAVHAIDQNEERKFRKHLICGCIIQNKTRDVGKSGFDAFDGRLPFFPGLLPNAHHLE